MQIEYINTEDLVPYINNPKEHPASQVKKIAGSIRNFGFRVPCLVRSDNSVVAGHGRIMAVEEHLEGQLDSLLEELEEGTDRYRSLEHVNEGEVPCIISDDMTEAQAKAFRIADNRVAESGWEVDLLKIELEELEDEEDILPEEDFAISDLGFEEDELDFFEEEVEVEEDDFEEPDEVETDIERGDVFQLGDHRLMCGDATDEGNVENLMDGDKADMVFTDPPYSVGIGAKNRALDSIDKAGQKTNDIDGDAGDIEDTAESIWKPAFENINNILKDGGGYYITAPQGGDQMMMMMMMMDGSIPCKHELIWVKNQPAFSMGRLDYDYKHEPILYGWKGSHNFLGNGDFTKSIWEVEREKKCDLHPTMKPIKLITNAILNSSKQNDIVLDLFGGSGSTLIACEQLDRKCYMMEIDPQYCQVIIDRWEDYTDEKAVKINED